MNPGREKTQPKKHAPLVVGHRGWLARYPENTLVGFEAAIELGVDFLELDIHLSSDGHIVVIHDEDPYRTTGVRGSVKRMTLKRIRQLDAGRWFDAKFTGQRIPALEEVLELADGRVGLAVEVKAPGRTADALDEKLIPLLEDFSGPVVVHSFDADYITDFKCKAPDIRTGYLCAATMNAVRQTQLAGAEAIHPAWRTLRKRLAQEARKAGLGIMIWTARTRRDCTHMVKKDCDAIGADCPDHLIDVLIERGLRAG